MREKEERARQEKEKHEQEQKEKERKEAEEKAKQQGEWLPVDLVYRLIAYYHT